MAGDILFVDFGADGGVCWEGWGCEGGGQEEGDGCLWADGRDEDAIEGAGGTRYMGWRHFEMGSKE